jgi:hypothetical protein
MRRSSAANDNRTSWLCEGLSTKDLIAGSTIAGLTSLIERDGFSKRAARAIARKVMMRAASHEETPAVNHVKAVKRHIEGGIHRRDDGSPSGWGLFWSHLNLMHLSAHSALRCYRAPSTPGRYEKHKGTWSLVGEHDWRLELEGIDLNADEHVAAALLNGVNLAFRIMREDKPDVGDLLHLAIHVTELDFEVALRVSGVREFVEIGVAVSEKGAGSGRIETNRVCARELAEVRVSQCRCRAAIAFAQTQWADLGPRHPRASKSVEGY